MKHHILHCLLNRSVFLQASRGFEISVSTRSRRSIRDIHIGGGSEDAKVRESAYLLRIFMSVRVITWSSRRMICKRGGVVVESAVVGDEDDEEDGAPSIICNHPS